MIVDAISCLNNYAHVHPLFPYVIDALAHMNFATMESGIHEIKGKDIFLIIETAEPLSSHTPILEAHRKYIDIQFSIEGSFSCGWKSLIDCMDITVPFNEEKDITFFGDKPTLILPIPTDHFAIFFPSDAHAPMAPNEHVKKGIVKIAY